MSELTNCKSCDASTAGGLICWVCEECNAGICEECADPSDGAGLCFKCAEGDESEPCSSCSTELEDNHVIWVCLKCGADICDTCAVEEFAALCGGCVGDDDE